MNRLKFISFPLRIALMLLVLTFSTSVPASFLGLGKAKDEPEPVVEEEMQEEDLSVLAQQSKEEADDARYMVESFTNSVKYLEDDLAIVKKKAEAAKQAAEAAELEYDLLKAKSKSDKTLRTAASKAKAVAKDRK